MRSYLFTAFNQNLSQSELQSSIIEYACSNNPPMGDLRSTNKNQKINRIPHNRQNWQDRRLDIILIPFTAMRSAQKVNKINTKLTWSIT